MQSEVQKKQVYVKYKGRFVWKGPREAVIELWVLPLTQSKIAETQAPRAHQRVTRANTLGILPIKKGPPQDSEGDKTSEGEQTSEGERMERRR